MKTTSLTVLCRAIALGCSLIASSAHALDYYVDRNSTGPHDGLSWATAWTNLRAATRAPLAPGDTVWIRAGVYPEKVNVTNSGAVLVPATNLVAILPSNRVVFPPDVDLSAWTNPSGLAVCIYRSLQGNNGVFDVTAISPSSHTLWVSGRLHAESPWSGDAYPLRAALLRPVRWRNADAHLPGQRVVIDVSSLPSPSTAFYLGGAIGDGSADAWPANANVFEGIDITGSTNGSGLHLQSSSYNTFVDCRAYETAKPGFLIAGNTNRPALYNMLWRCAAWNTPYETVYIGAGGQGWDRNHAHFTHVIAGEFFTTNGPRGLMENAIDIKEGNIGSMIAQNVIRDARMVTGGNGLIDIRPRSDFTWIVGNRFLRFEAGAGSSPRAAVMVYNSNRAVRIANNVIFTTSASNTLAGLRLQEGHQAENEFVFNTVVGPHRGALYEYYGGSTGGWLIANNIWDARSTPYTVWGSEGGLTLSHNLYSSNPPAEYAGEAGRLVASPHFRNKAGGDLRLDPASPAIDSALPHEPYDLDAGGYLRDHAPDSGAHEYDDPRLVAAPALSSQPADSNAFRLIWRSRVPHCDGTVRWYLRPSPPLSTNLVPVATASAGVETNALFSLLPFGGGAYDLLAEVEECGGTATWYTVSGPLWALSDADADQLPAWWESLYFGGPTQAVAHALSANNANTLLESFIAGLDPSDASAALLASIAIENGDRVVAWTPYIGGRSYEIHRATNLLGAYAHEGAVTATNRFLLGPPHEAAFFNVRVSMTP